MRCIAVDEFKVKEFARRLKEARVQSGLSVKDVSKRTGMSMDSIRRFERGDSAPNLSKFELLLQVLEIEPDVLLCDSVFVDKVMLEDELYTSIERLRKSNVPELSKYLHQIAQKIAEKGD